ncbi:hypothetical protein PCANB_000326 [Pneumocystis canis]|nr:hypothetical protein PCK1_000310 [Pneumocystis canis]KAG5437980.1 hypothetical protein PCANB_000326 [Pneumocystis canis]
MSYLLVIVGTKDNPLFQTEFGTYKAGGDGVARFREEIRHRNQFIIHATLDLVEEIQWVSHTMHMKSLDTFHQATISTFLTAGNIKFMLLHEIRNEEGIRHFFQEVYDLYTKCLMNPFYEVDMPITSFIFEQKVKSIAKKYL